jgi:hypothetical protein
MKGTLLLVAVAFFGGFVAGKQYYQPKPQSVLAGVVVSPEQEAYLAPVTGGRALGVPSPTFRCDGRRYCSEMTSREEADFFVKNCPDTAMDGDEDGIACEYSPRWSSHFSNTSPDSAPLADDDPARHKSRR